MADFLGVEIGGTKLQVVLGDENACIKSRWRGRVDPAKKAAGILAQIEEACAELTAGAAVLAVGVGFGGPVDRRKGRIGCSHHIEGWSGFNLSHWLESRLGCPVWVDNDANVAALGEAAFGAGRGASSVFYVTLGSGVGGGFVVDGRIFHSYGAGESEIGHLRWNREGAILESRCSGWAVDRKIREAIRNEPSSCLKGLVGGGEGGEARHLGPALDEDDALAKRILAETAADLAFGLSHVTHLMNPKIVVLGGGLSLLGERLRSAVAAELEGFVMEAFHPVPPVTLSELGEDAVPVGALDLARSTKREFEEDIIKHERMA